MLSNTILACCGKQRICIWSEGGGGGRGGVWGGGARGDTHCALSFVGDGVQQDMVRALGHAGPSINRLLNAEPRQQFIGSETDALSCR